MARPRHPIGTIWPHECAWPVGTFLELDYGALERRVLAHLLYGDDTMRPNTDIFIFSISDPTRPRLGELSVGDYFRFTSGVNVYIVIEVERSSASFKGSVRYVQLANGATWDTNLAQRGRGRELTVDTCVTRLRAVDLRFEFAL